ncbi:hypothetical protein PYW07_010486 [Mythimna separata]|uniref:Lysozyme n=1 Tax=Mythimna separata TaxID=271217 RepID=A0AAD8DMF1_MYTSE|nr:hypothetical protein PYW07_010486 [Mythimna separata]
MKLLLILVVFSFITSEFCEAKVFSRCTLSRQLLKYKGIQKSYLGTWVCLIEKVSKRDTKAFLAKSSGKKFYGLYQIPNEWCKEKKRGGLCNIACEALLDDDIRDDTACALQIAEKHGFQYWSKWTTRCKNDNFITTEIYKCPDLMRLTPERSLSSSSRRSPPRLRRSAHNSRRISKVTRFRRSRRIN